MRTVRAVVDLRSTLAPARRDGLTIGLVPTMGALHEGHLSLVRHARRHCEVVVVSLFVNPAQFNERADLERYPRQEREDAELAARAGADVLFAPSVEEVYPRGFATSVEVLGVTERLEGEARGCEHFRGVTTVVTKLLCMTLPDVAYFGQKDVQQVFVIRRLASDLNLPVRIEALPTVREPDDLAMSSRNALLAPGERARALALPAALRAARALAATGERSAQALIDAAREAMRPFDVQPEYVALVDHETFEPVDALVGEVPADQAPATTAPAIEAPAGDALLVLAARVGEVRLIDNAILSPSATQTPSQPLEGKAIATCSV
jgi:pantoate--beta-alanine ligase